MRPIQSKLEPSGYYAVPSVTRYFDHIQHLKAVNEARTILPNEPYWLVNFDLDNMPPLERKVEVKEKKPKKDGAAADASAGKKDKKEKNPAEQTPAETNPVEEAKPAAEGEKPQGQKKEKKPKEKKPEGDKKAAKPAPPPPTGPLPSMIDLRVGKVLEGESYGLRGRWEVLMAWLSPFQSLVIQMRIRSTSR